MKNHRGLFHGMTMVAILAVAAVAFHYRPVEAQLPPVGPSVTIGNPLPLPVVNVAVKTPFQALLFPLAFVPTGQRLTIELVTFKCVSWGGQNVIPVQLFTTAGGTQVSHSFFPRFLRNESQDTLYGSFELVRLYADGGTYVFPEVVGGAGCDTTISGFLEPE